MYLNKVLFISVCSGGGCGEDDRGVIFNALECMSDIFQLYRAKEYQLGLKKTEFEIIEEQIEQIGGQEEFEMHQYQTRSIITLVSQKAREVQDNFVNVHHIPIRYWNW
ncbi:MAG: hypothetical protein EZS28_029107 [Streblomastix strix]|uniref:Uncharacterized protein n=1 Tax=Streblomastix strix TaxID=222440 RepID=A0A5J4V012_9EUKA|nr:MAG: hypothetical protein EZS28_029107 [Streblomastix strix]